MTETEFFLLSIHPHLRLLALPARWHDLFPVLSFQPGRQGERYGPAHQTKPSTSCPALQTIAKSTTAQLATTLSTMTPNSVLRMIAYAFTAWKKSRPNRWRASPAKQRPAGWLGQLWSLNWWKKFQRRQQGRLHSCQWKIALLSYSPCQCLNATCLTRSAVDPSPDWCWCLPSPPIGRLTAKPCRRSEWRRLLIDLY